MSGNKLIIGVTLAISGAIVCLAITAQAQYYDSESNSGKMNIISKPSEVRINNQTNNFASN